MSTTDVARDRPAAATGPRPGPPPPAPRATFGVGYTMSRLINVPSVPNR